MRVLWALVYLLGGTVAAATAHAQQALESTGVRAGRLPEPMLTLRPEPALRVLAQDVAAVLELRTGQRVEVGDAPPPGILEAVPAGHVALAEQEGRVLLVLGAAGGRSYDATVEVDADEEASAARAVALAAEALRDTAVELSRVNDVAPAELSVQASGQARRARLVVPGAPVSDDGSAAEAGRSKGILGDIDPLLYVRVYSGASTATESVAGGIGTGIGVCVERHCLFVAGELPLFSERGDELDVRYRYPTFISGFYSRPFQFGRFTPGASIGFLTRLGHFEADMGYGDDSLDTDLGARGSLELAFEMVEGFDLMSEGGLDYTIDRDRLKTGDGVIARGDRWSPWAQMALRFRP